MSKTNTNEVKVRKARTWQSDLLGIIIFVAIVAAGIFIINLAVFRSYLVTGPSMEPTFYTNDRVIVNRLPVTWAALSGKSYIPERGQIIIFENPHHKANSEDQFIIKRAIAFPGEKVIVKDCDVKVITVENPGGFNPYEDFNIKPTCVTGSVDTTVPDDEIFVIGDHRDGNYSLDSRSGLGTIPLKKIVGPVGIQFYPLNKFHLY